MIMTILGVRRLLYYGIVLAGGVGLAAWGIVYRWPLESGRVARPNEVIPTENE